MATGEIVEPRGIVKANNDLLRSRTKIKDVVACRIFMAFASLVDENDVAENGNFLEYKISASSVLGGCTGGNDYKQVRDAAYSLVDQKIERRIGKNGFQVYTLFCTIKYDNGIITGEFHKDLVPFFIAARGLFTRLNLQQYMKLPSIYSQKLFGLLKSWDDKPEINIPVSELHELLDTPSSFRANFTEFRRWVLEKAHKDITGKTSLRYEWEAIKKGRAVESVRFIFVQKLALPIAQAKVEETRDKQVQRNNTAMLTAMRCLKEHDSSCEGGYQKPAICDICRAFCRK